MVLITIQIDSLEDAMMIKHDVDLTNADPEETSAAQVIIACMAQMGLISKGDGDGPMIED